MSLKCPYLNLPAQVDCETLWGKLKAQYKRPLRHNLCNWGLTDDMMP